jgi:hypothetical protein
MGRFKRRSAMSFSFIPPLLAGFLGTVALAFIIGLELHAYRRRNTESAAAELGFGTTRTIALIAALGFVLWALSLFAFCVGLAVLGALLLLDYSKRLAAGDAALLPAIIALFGY